MKLVDPRLRYTPEPVEVKFVPFHAAPDKEMPDVKAARESIVTQRHYSRLTNSLAKTTYGNERLPMKLALTSTPLDSIRQK